MLLEGGRLKVRLNLGDGEGEVSSPVGHRLNDLSWHDISLERNGAQVTLVVDKKHKSWVRLPGKLSELNIHYGVFVGGMGDFSQIFLGLLSPFRGCLSDAVYNGVHLLRVARERGSTRRVAGGCSDQFAASTGATMVFTERTAFAVLRPETVAVSPSGTVPGAFPAPSLATTIQLQLRTAVEDGSVVHLESETPERPGQSAQPQSPPPRVELLLRSGRLRLTVTTISGWQAHLDGTTTVADNEWHQIAVSVSATSASLSMDGGDVVQVAMASAELGSLQRLILGSSVGRTSAAESSEGFIGCVRGLRVGGLPVGFPQVTESDAVETSCETVRRCEDGKCGQDEQCERTAGKVCHCGDDCDRGAVSAPADSPANSDITFSNKLFTSSALEVTEGGESLLTSRNIRTNFNLTQYNMSASDLTFTVRVAPAEGELLFVGGDGGLVRRFTLHELLQGSVRYVHSGSESDRDRLELQPSLPSAGPLVLDVLVSPVDDPPRLMLTSDILTMPAGARLPLDGDLVRLSDPDTDPDRVVVTVTADGAHVELTDRPGQTVGEFTQAQLDSGEVEVVLSSAATAQLTLRAFDGRSRSAPAQLHVDMFPLQVTEVRNSELVVSLGSAAVITTEKLQFRTNDPGGDLELLLTAISPPAAGQLERLRGNKRWEPTDSFTLLHLQRDAVRYRHTGSKPGRDTLRLRLSYRGLSWPSEVTFHISAVSVSPRLVYNRELVINRAQEAAVGGDHLLAVCEPVTDGHAAVTFLIVSTPQFGDLFYVEPRSGRRTLLIVGSVFSQEDVNSTRIIFRLHRRSLSAFSDEFRFRLGVDTSEHDLGGRAVTGAAKKVQSAVQTFQVRHVPARTAGMIAIGKLEVGEGGSVTLTSDVIKIDIPRVEALLFNVTDQPVHGRLRLSGGGDVRHFTSGDLDAGRLRYEHDDSETRRDRFSFVARSLTPGAALRYRGSVSVSVTLKNDEPPRRVSSAPLFVARGGRRAVRRAQLAFADADLGTTAADIQYRRRSLPAGALYLHPDYQTEVVRFSQADIDADRLVLQHTGEDRSRALLWVSDGVHYATAELEIVASEPFVRVRPAPSLAVPRGDIQTLTAAQLWPETNIEVSDENIRFVVTGTPAHGSLRMRGSPAAEFSFSDVMQNATEYENDGSAAARDSLHLEVRAGRLSSNASLEFHVLPESYWEPLRVVHNRTALVAEASSVTVSADHLQLMHTSVDPAHVRYTVTAGPLSGYLLLLGRATRPEHITFSQADVDAGNLSYVQTAANATEDSFEFSVTNGIVSTAGLRFVFEVAPSRLRLVTRNVSALEGGTVTVPATALGVASAYHRRRLSHFQVQQRPRHGRLQLRDRPGEPLDTVSIADLRAGRVQYAHAGDEIREDCLTGAMHTETESSEPGTLCFEIGGVNDRTPRLVNNTGVTVFAGGAAVVTTTQLDAADADRPPDRLRFLVSAAAECGQVTLTSDPGSPVTAFTRDQLVAGQVAVGSVNSDSDSCTLRISVSDGVHQSPPEPLVLTVEELQLRMATNSRLHVFPTMQQTITRGHLLARTNDPGSTPRHITYTVLQKPKLGKITREGPDGRTREVSSFTQADINASRVLYEQEAPLDALSGRDAVLLRVETPHARPLTPVRLAVRVSVTAMTRGGLRGYSAAVPLTVTEGGRGTVTPRQLDVEGVAAFLRSHAAAGRAPELRVRLTTPPRHGALSVPLDSRLTASDIADGRLVYQHDHSDSSADSFGYSLLLVTPAGTVLLYNGSVEVTITAVNDQPFRLETPAPGVRVVQKQMVVIEHTHLHVIDADNPPADIVFRIINGPSRGVLERAEAPGERVITFSQEDVNLGRLQYRQDGSLGSDQFHFSVSDGHHQPLVLGFVITIEPLTLEVRVTEPVEIVQGESGTVLGADLLSVTTNGLRERVFFNVTREPRYGELLVTSDPATRFSLAAVDSSSVTYRQVDMQASNDSFEVCVYDELNVVTSVAIPVHVRPLVTVSVLRAVPASQTVIGPAVLDASQLAAATKSNPVFRIVRGSRLGFVSQRMGSGGGGDGGEGGDRGSRAGSQPVWNLTSFTHAEVAQGAVVFVSVDVPLGANDTLDGGIELELSAPRVQPARLRLPVLLVSAASLAQAGSAPGVNSVMGRGRGPPTGVPFRHDLLLVGGAVAAAAVGSVLLLVTVKCVTDRRQRPARAAAGQAGDSGGDRDPAAGQSAGHSHRKTAFAGVAQRECDSCSAASLERARSRRAADSTSDPEYSGSPCSQLQGQQWV
ncbi:chondroitin sulfate proteoglycan 4-like [Amphibalanus amphitrite]|uniref:chondroitin sulfate proteoglycan 4-like n=1 Tax=Amphibalanus amphitrite TaxID=1232801 RepID=UPI001C915308|nr:chondroitin sulfate proteoglycan 4-like [Amphibalanus amphitrite]